MTLDLDTFLVALYTIVDDLYREHFARLFILEGGECHRRSSDQRDCPSWP